MIDMPNEIELAVSHVQVASDFSGKDTDPNSLTSS